MRNLNAVLTKAGSSLNDVVEVSVFLTDIADADELSPVYKTYWGDLMPARTYVLYLIQSTYLELTCFPSCVAVKELPYGSDIEIKCVAVLSKEAA